MASPEIPKQYKAAVYDKPGSVSTEIRTLDTPEPGAGEVLVRLTHSGVCHSDFGVMTNSWSGLPFPTQPGQVGGHEGVGEVVKLGPGTENSPVKVGQRVGIKWVAYACGGCLPCLGGRDGLCLTQKISGYYYPGTFQQYAIAPAHYATPIPDGLDSAAAAPMLCAGVTVYAALKKADVNPGEWVVLLGAGGGLGHLAVQLAAKGMGYRVIGVDHPSKKDLIKEMGAEHFIGIDENVTERVKELTDTFGAHGVLVLTAANGAYATSVDLLRFGGTVVCVGVPEGTPVPITSAQPGTLILGEKKIVGSAVGTRKDAMEVLDLASRGVVKTHYRTEPLEKLTEVFQEMEEQKLQGRVVIDLNA